MTQSIKSIRRKAADNSLEVEHILEAAVQRLAGLPELLDELSAANRWSDSAYLPDGSHVVPLARWARVASTYCRNGISGLKMLLSLPNHESFVLALLEELHSEDAIDAILSFFEKIIESPTSNQELALKVVNTLNLILCFKPNSNIEASKMNQILKFTHEMINNAEDQVARATPVLLLRAVGDETSIIAPVIKPSNQAA